ncbi:LysR family transcriptional regulator [Pseudomonas sp. NPDC089401]|uniref:LysR family transcriptional regulator n=1 Tax=Pseudomonas sp. NPDC089401 TaxID=3364462 RepID=UPI00382C7A6A
MIAVRRPRQKRKKGATVGQECMSGLEWESQRVFLAVLRSGSLSGAAKLLGIAQATARRRLDHLEQVLGLSLFTRSPSGLTPTSGAQRLIEHVESMDLAAQAFNRMASAETAPDQGTVRVTCGELLGVEVLPGLLRDFHHGHPGLKLELSIGDALEDIARLQSDIAVRLLRPVEADITVRRVGSLRVGVHASAACLRRHGTPASLQALRQGPLIGPDRRSADLRRFVQSGLCEVDQHFAIASDNHLAQLAALKAGLGFGLCPTRMARDLGLVRVLPDRIGFEVDVWLAMHSDLRRVGRIARVFEVLGEALQEYLNEGDQP